MTHLTQDEAELVARLEARHENVWEGVSQRWQADPLCTEAALAISRIAEERGRAEMDRDKFHAIAEDKLADTRLVGAGGRGEGFGFDLTGGPIPYITEYLFQFMGARDEKGPSNYAEIEVQHNTFGAMTLTMQRRSGQTPHQLRAAAEARATAAEAALSQMKEALDATFVPWLRDWCKGRFGKWITHNTAKGALLDLQARALAQQPDKEGV